MDTFLVGFPMASLSPQVHITVVWKQTKPMAGILWRLTTRFVCMLESRLQEQMLRSCLPSENFKQEPVKESTWEIIAEWPVSFRIVYVKTLG